ncbi:trypsin-like peptidase domain-containing protein [Kribbella sp. NPDC051952]|uniref:trypsin-like peptidase domain-containing protein n=1 Tax=Kribbella sp. NPDC051952 TaxID=3154851 RepID=UPI00342B18FC
MPTVHEPSAMSLYLSMSVNGAPLANGTGVVVGHSGKFWLVTAGHNITGRDAVTGELISQRTGAWPDAVAIRHTWMGQLGQWTDRVVPLFKDGQPIWLQHPSGPVVDVVAVPLLELDTVATIYAVNLDAPGLAELAVPDEVSIVGYPFNITSGEGFPVWTRGTIATELDFDHDELPMFLVDSRTRTGQSGAPVFWYSSHGMIPVRGGWKLNDGQNPPLTLLGIYSGRTDQHSDLGRVFKMSAVREVIEHGKPPDGVSPIEA